MGECKYCKMVQDKTNLLYEDDKIMVVVPEKSIVKGHITIVTKEHYPDLQAIDKKDIEHLFYASSFATTAIFENLEAHGTNIICNTGSDLKKNGHFHIHAIPRTMEDGLNLMWEPKRQHEETMKELQKKIKDKCDMIGVKKKKKEVVDLDKKPEKLDPTEEKPSEGAEEDLEKVTEETEKKDEEKEDKKPEKIPHEADFIPDKHKKEESYLIRQLRRVP